MTRNTIVKWMLVVGCSGLVTAAVCMTVAIKAFEDAEVDAVEHRVELSGYFKQGVEAGLLGLSFEINPASGVGGASRGGIGSREVLECRWMWVQGYIKGFGERNVSGSESASEERAE